MTEKTEVLSSPIEALGALIKSSQCIARLELENTECLEKFEADMREKTQDLMKVAALGGLRPKFTWWQVGQMWPRDDGGWTVLLRKTMFEGTLEKVRNGHPGDGQRGVHGR